MAKATPGAPSLPLLVALCLFVRVAEAAVNLCGQSFSGSGCSTGGDLSATASCPAGFANANGKWQPDGNTRTENLGFFSTVYSAGSACCGRCANDPTCVYWDVTLNPGNNEATCNIHSSSTCRSFSSDPFSVAGGGCVAGANGDPHFVSFKGKTKYDFTGYPNTSYCIITDMHLQVNGYFGGYETSGPNAKVYTWFYKIAVLINGHNVVFSSRRGPEVEYLGGFVDSITVDGQEVTVAPQQAKVFPDGSSIRFKEANATVTVFGLDVYQADIYEVEVKDILKATLTARPAHPDLRTADEAHVHFDVTFDSVKLTQSAHGVLGQTFPAKRLKESYNFALAPAYDHSGSMVAGPDGEGFLDGAVVDYATSDLLAADCNFNQYEGLALKDVAGGAGFVGRRMLELGDKSEIGLTSYSGALSTSGK